MAYKGFKMKSENVALLIVGSACLMAISFAVGFWLAEDTMWDRAVEHDVAEYVCDDTQGCHFEWKDRLDD